MTARRIVIPEVPAGLEKSSHDPWSNGFWNASWVRLPGDPRAPFHSAYRLKFELAAAAKIRIHVAADERYILHLDAHSIGLGNDRGDLGRWFFDTYELDLGAGRHELFAHVWSFGEGGSKAAHAQMTLRPGFLVASETHSGVIDTGVAPWESARLEGIEPLSPLAAWGIGPRRRFLGEPTNPAGFGRKAEWLPVEIDEVGRSRRGANGVFPSRLLTPSLLPAQWESELTEWTIVHLSSPPEGETSRVPIRAADHLKDEVEAWTAMLAGGDPIVLAPGERRRAIVRFPQYACVYPRVRASGAAGSRVRVHVQEALFETMGDGDRKTWSKGKRHEIEGKLFTTLWHGKDGIGDEFCPRGFKQDFQSFDWLAGMYAEVFVESGDQSLALFDVGFTETRYPLDLAGWPTCEEPKLSKILAICRRGAEESAHETFIDCAYERMQYVFDARIEALCSYVFGADDRLARKAMVQFRDSLGPDGMIASRHPARERQVIAPFGLQYIGMIWDYARWRGDREFVRELLPAARAILDHYESSEFHPTGWNYMDWVAGWPAGIPPRTEEGKDPTVGMLYLHAKLKAAQLASWCAGAEVSSEASPIPDWILRSDHAESESSEHFAALAATYPACPPDLRQALSEKLSVGHFESRCTFSFAHLLLEAFTALGRPDLILPRVFADWGPMVENGLTTTIEHPEPTRSDCHGWGAHPAYHLVTGVLGLQPVGFGGREFRLWPHRTDLHEITATVFTPAGPLKIWAHGAEVSLDVPTGVSVHGYER